MNRLACRAAAVAAILFLSPAGAQAQDRRQNEPGNFDFYVLALSWSPSFCEASREQSPNRRPSQQCGARPYSFVVHGLWPQYERGFPEYCKVPAPRLPRSIVSAMLDLMPAPGLIYSEWDKHGTCSGLSERAYFEAVRKARAATKIPERFVDPESMQTVTPAEIAQEFVAANPGMTAGSVSITCDSRRLREVRICMTREFRFRDCEEMSRRSCSREKIAVPPVRGG
ncbi:MAG TPA: ribonuclease T2 [Pseudorhodoplanes sp.]|jgi:ribonuclease T2|nr:ribonuclease T2 [Pseudorhodoplanes sp.]